jgi:hypothetical protein
MHNHCLLWSRRHEIVFTSIKYELIHLMKNIAKFDMQTSIRICDVVKQSFNHVRVLNVQIDNKLKWNAHFRNVQKKMITQILILFQLIAFTWRACFSRIKLIYTTIIRSIIIYDFIIWHASHERSNSVVVATIKLIKLQQQNLRLINDNFKTISMQILETVFISDCVYRIHDFSAVASLFVRNLKDQYTLHILSSSSLSLLALHYCHDFSAL